MAYLRGGRQLTYAFFFLIFLLVISNEMQTVKSYGCERPSTTWSGFCGNSDDCNEQCINWEHPAHGACHADGWGMACFCYFC